jgi:hypothetical protein
MRWNSVHDGRLWLLTSALGGFIVGLLGVIALSLWAPVAVARTAQTPTSAPSSARVFGSDAGMVLNFVKPDKTADFEAVMARLKEALRKSDNPQRQQQARSWKVFRVAEPGANGSVLYIFTIDPPVKGADYTISTILAEAFPTEVQVLYKQYAESYASGMNYVNLNLLADLGR